MLLPWYLLFGNYIYNKMYILHYEATPDSAITFWVFKNNTFQYFSDSHAAVYTRIKQQAF